MKLIVNLTILVFFVQIKPAFHYQMISYQIIEDLASLSNLYNTETYYGVWCAANL